MGRPHLITGGKVFPLPSPINHLSSGHSRSPPHPHSDVHQRPPPFTFSKLQQIILSMPALLVLAGNLPLFQRKVHKPPLRSGCLCVSVLFTPWPSMSNTTGAICTRQAPKWAVIINNTTDNTSLRWVFCSHGQLPTNGRINHCECQVGWGEPWRAPPTHPLKPSHIQTHICSFINSILLSILSKPALPSWGARAW